MGHRQILCHSYLPIRSLYTCSVQQSLVPKGGIEGGVIGAMDGGVMGQTRGGHIGGISSEFVQSGRFSPFTQAHLQAAQEYPEKPIRTTVRTSTLKPFILFSCLPMQITGA